MGTSRRRGPVLLAAAIGLAAGCATTPVPVDGARLTANIDRRADVVIARPELDRAAQKLADAVADDKGLAADGERLFDKLGEDPALAQRFEAIVGAITEHPATMQLMAQLMRENPAVTAEQLPALFEKRVDGMLDSPGFDKAFEAAFADVLERPEVLAAGHRLESAALANRDLDNAVDAAIKGRLDSNAWSRRLIALNGGHPPDPARAADLIAEHAFSPDRLVQFYTALFSLPVVASRTAAACRRLLEAPTFQAHVARGVRRLVADADFQKRAVAALAAVFTSEGRAERMEGPLRQFLGLPIVTAEIAALLDAAINDAALSAIGNEAIAAIVADPSFRDTLSKLLDGW